MVLLHSLWHKGWPPSLPLTKCSKGGGSVSRFTPDCILIYRMPTWPTPPHGKFLPKTSDCIIAPPSDQWERPDWAVSASSTNQNRPSHWALVFRHSPVTARLPPLPVVDAVTPWGCRSILHTNLGRAAPSLGKHEQLITKTSIIARSHTPSLVQWPPKIINKFH